MNREEAVEILSRPKKMKNAPAEIIEAHEMAIRALDQEPILDKVRAEIADIYCGQYCENPFTADAVREMALDIIDKYRQEGE